MKKRLLILLAALLCCVGVFLFVSCGNCQHRDENDDSLCDKCGESYTDGSDVAPHHTHVWGEWVEISAATCTAQGLKSRACPCGESETQYIPSGHIYSDWCADHTYHWRECTRTGCVDEPAKETHIYDSENTCTKCLYYKDEGVVFTLQNDNTYAVTDYNGSETTVLLPSRYKGVAVTAIADNALARCNFASVSIPASVTSIGKSAFYGCGSLENITLPFVGASLHGTENTYFGYIFGANSYDNHNSGFVPNSLKNVVITGGDSIDAWAFSNCVNLTSVTISEGITTIEACAFQNCSALLSVSIPDSVNFIGYHAFRYCTKLMQVENGVSYVGKWAVDTDKNITSVTLRADTVGIGGVAFLSCNSLVSITIPEGVRTICIDAFYSCNALVSISIPNSLVYVDEVAFSGLPDSAFTVYKNGKYLGNSQNPYLFLHSVVDTGAYGFTIPNSTRFIALGAFQNCDNLTSVTIPSSVISIGKGAFYGCDKLKSITIPSNVTDIGNFPFADCASLECITVESGNAVYHSAGNCLIETASKTLISGCKNSVIPADGSVTSIGRLAFSGCVGLETIRIPSSVTSIDYRAFSECDNLISVIFEVTEGWHASTSTNGMAISAISLANTSTAATYLRSTYDDYDWKRG